MEPVDEPRPYVLRGSQRLEDILRIEADLLRGEGIDPEWPRFKDNDDAEHHEGR